MKRTSLLLAVVGLAAPAAMAQIAFTGSYSENFDSLPLHTATPNPAQNAAWANNSTIPGLFAFRIAANTGAARPTESATVTSIPAATGLILSNGSSTSGGIYSFGATSDSNRAFGSIGSGTPNGQSWGFVLRNDSTTTYNAANLAFRAQQWRNGGNTSQIAQTHEFDYAVLPGTTDLTNAGQLPGNKVTGYTRDTRFDLVSFTNTPTASALDGNTAPNFTDVTGQIVGLTWAPGELLVVRWYDFNDTGNDMAMAIDNLSITAQQLIAANVTTVITDSPDPLQLVGGQVSYSITPTNAAITATASSTLTFTLPSNVQFVSYSGTFSNVGPVYTLSMGAIAASSAGPVQTLVLQPNVAFPANAPLTIPFVSAPGNNSTSVSTVVVNSSDQAVTVTSDASCITTLDQTINYTVGYSNNGPASAIGSSVAVTLSPNVFINSITPSAGSISQLGNVVTWTLGTQVASSSQTLAIVASVNAEGGQQIRAVATSTSVDALSSNNTATLQTNTPSTAAAELAELSSVFGAITSNIDVLGFPGNFGTAAGGPAFNSFAINRPFASPDGTRFVFSGETTNLDTSNGIIVAFDGTTYRTVAQEGITVLDAGDPAGTTVFSGATTFDRIRAINDTGEVLFTTRIAAVGTPRVLVKATPAGNSFTYQIIARQGTPATFLGLTNAGDPILFGATMSVAKGGMLNDGAAAYTFISDTGLRAAVKTDNANATTIFSRTTQAAFSPAGQANATTANLSTFRDNTDQDANTRGFSIAADGTTWLLEATLSNVQGITGTLDEVLILNTSAAANTVVLQEGYTVPGSSLTQTVGSYTHSEVEFDGQWISLGGFNIVPPATRSDDFVIRNGNVLAVTGNVITPSATETWSDQIFGGTFTFATGRGSDYVIGGLTNFGDSTTDSVLVHNGTTVVLREGQPINVGTNDAPNIWYAGPTLRNHRAFIDATRNLWVVMDVRNESWPCGVLNGAVIGGLALVKIELPAVVVPTCLADLVGGDGNPPGGDGVDGNDFQAFLNAFGAGSALADVVGGDGNPPGGDGADGNDFQAFLNAFGAGC